MSRLCICLLTYNRFSYAKKTLESILNNLVFTGEIGVHIADDGSPDGYISRLVDIAGGYGINSVTASNSNRTGYGGNYNLAMQNIHSFYDLIIPLEDDWELARTLYLDRYTRVLEADAGIGCIRMGYLGYTQALLGEVRFVKDTPLLVLNPDSPERHIFSGHPRVETVAWERKVGPWPENLEAGFTEFEVSGRRESRIGVAWPMDIDPYGNMFGHIGSEKA